MPARVLMFFRDQCKSSMRAFPEKKENIESLKNEVTEIHKNLRESTNKVPGYAYVVKELKQETTFLKQNFQALEKKVKEKPNHDVVEFEPTIHELKERENSSMNILVFGVQEISESNRVKRSTRETGNIHKVLEKVKSYVIMDDLKVFRLGKYNPEKLRPIRVILLNEEEALNTLRHKNDIPEDGVYIKSDQTQSQIKYLKELLKELEDRKSAGEEDIKVNYIHGKIVKESKADVKQTDLTFILLTEIWLNNQTTDVLIALEGYRSFRRDGKNREEDGIMEYVKENIHSIAIHSHQEEKYKTLDPAEALCIDVTFKKFRLLLGCIYRPNNTSPQRNSVLVRTIEEAFTTTRKMCGDFNYEEIS
ncbi:hypothetical protein HHI36_000987 [Cryptolaemus montrouzieri]|uniref:Uncharacterized protein n=1 Tax=Cryptolaemus montrouzieri TaxID=559131 RepID=A0ABD2P763_9CUCU